LEERRPRIAVIAKISLRRDAASGREGCSSPTELRHSVRLNAGSGECTDEARSNPLAKIQIKGQIQIKGHY
jgi:hypothetical protein